jgi:hypothetical protein
MISSVLDNLSMIPKAPMLGAFGIIDKLSSTEEIMDVY